MNAHTASFFVTCPLHNDHVSRVGVDVAHVDIAAHLHVAVDAPTGAPLVAHDPKVAGKRIRSVADDGQRVVDDVGRARGIVENAATVCCRRNNILYTISNILIIYKLKTCNIESYR